MALVMRSRELHGHAPRRRVGCSVAAPWRLWRPRLRDNHQVLRLEHRELYVGHLPRPWGRSERRPWLDITKVNNPVRSTRATRQGTADIRSYGCRESERRQIRSVTIRGACTTDSAWLRPEMEPPVAAHEM